MRTVERKNSWVKHLEIQKTNVGKENIIICRYKSMKVVSTTKDYANLLGFENERQLLESLKCAFVKY